MKLGLLSKSSPRLVPSVAGLYLFGRLPQAYFPEWGVVCMASSGATLADPVAARSDLEGSLEQLVASAIAFVDERTGGAEALKSEFGKVQLAVISECIAKTGSAQLFTERYLDIRRKTATAIIERGQKEGSIIASVAAGDLYDRIYGTLFYRFLFQFRPLSDDYARKLVASLLTPR